MEGPSIGVRHWQAQKSPAFTTYICDFALRDLGDK
jgi:hypothetical protein